MSDDLVAFLRACLDEDESAALGAKGDTSGRWQQDDGPPEDIELYAASGKLTMGQARHIARHDPARVLAEVAAKRRIVDECERAVDYDSGGMALMADNILCLLALPNRDHPDYRSEWAPGA